MIRNIAIIMLTLWAVGASIAGAIQWELAHAPQPHVPQEVIINMGVLTFEGDGMAPDIMPEY